MQNLAASIEHAILLIGKYRKLYLKTALKPHDLNTAEGMVLLALYGCDGQTQAEILMDIHRGSIGVTQEQLNDALHYDKGVMTRTMQALEQKGHIVRRENRADGRSSVFFLTDLGRSLQPTIQAILQAWSHHTLCGLSPVQLQTLDDTLRQLASRAQQMGGKQHE